MLVLARKKGESVLVPGINLEIQVLEVKKNGVIQLGFIAPKEVTIVRSEIKKPVAA